MVATNRLGCLSLCERVNSDFSFVASGAGFDSVNMTPGVVWCTYTLSTLVRALGI